MKKLKKVMAMFLALTMVMSMVFVGGARNLSYAATDDSTITLPLTLHDAHQDGLIFERATNNNGFASGSSGAKGLLLNELDSDNKIVYNETSIEYLAKSMQNGDLNRTPADATLVKVLKNKIEKGDDGKFVLGTVDSSKPVTDFYSIKTCCDAVSWMTYYMFRDGGEFYYDSTNYKPIKPDALGDNIKGDNIKKFEYTQSVPTYDKLVLKKQSDGSYSFDSSEKVNYNNTDQSIINDSAGELRGGLFPLNGLGFDAGKTDKNFAYTLESNGKFVYHKGEELYFDFNGDDDVYLFINKKLALDIGGAHTAKRDKVELESKCTIGDYTDKTWAEYLGLQEGKIYDFNFFYMERHTTQSNMDMKTNIRVYNAAAVPQKNAYVQNDNKEYKQIPYGGLIRAGKEITYEFVLTNTSDLKITNLTFNDDKLGVSLDENNINLNNTASPEDIDITIVDKDGNTTFEGKNNKDSSTLKEKLRDGIEPGETIRIKGFKHILSKEEVDKDTNGYLNTVTYTAQDLNNCVTLSDTASSLVRPVSSSDKAFVIDYGKPVTYEYSKVFDAKDQNNSYGTISFSNSTSQSVTGAYGTMKNNSDNKNVTYTLNKFMNGIDEFNFNQNIKSIDENGLEIEENLPTKVSMIPATSVYYEDDFGTDNNTDSSVSIVWTGKWDKDGTSQKETQGSDNSQYGWDKSYEDDKTYSNGSAHVSTEEGATATFTFTGTGVDVYSRTNGDVGSIRAILYNGKNTEDINRISYIDNISTSGDYYQIPTLSFENLDYGTYTVQIAVMPTKKDDGTYRSTYYLDGIRVYNPLKGNTTAEDAYDKAGESNAKYIKLRDTLLANGFGITDESTPGSVFIDRIDEQNGVTVGTKDDYEKYGPKNEVYLAKDQAVAFEIDGYQSSKNNVFVGLKALNKATTATITNDSEKITKEINSSSDLYYQITPTSSGRVVIKNNSDNILSITKLRITNASAVSATSSEVKLMATPALLSYAADFDSLSETKTTEEDKNTNLDEDDVIIDNPSDNNDNKYDNIKNAINTIWKSILNSIRDWFEK